MRRCMRTIFLKFLLFVLLQLFLCFPGYTDENAVEHRSESLGVRFKLPQNWIEKSFVRGQTEFFPAPIEGVFLMVSVIHPEKDDLSSADLEFFMHDFIFMSEEEKKMSDFHYRKITLSGLPAYEVEYSLQEEKKFRVKIFFCSANEKIYMIRYQTVYSLFGEYQKLVDEEIIPSFTVETILKTEARYQLYEMPEFGFQFYYPAAWRLIQMNISIPKMPVFADPNTGSNVFLSTQEADRMRKILQQERYSTGLVLSNNEPLLLAPDPDARLVVNVLELAYRVEPADIIENYEKGIRQKAKELEGFENSREFPITIDGQLAMEYSYVYFDASEKRKIRITHYITYANERLYHIQYAATDENYSKHIKEVERLLKYFKFTGRNTEKP
jgi:hypothetical protein